MNDLIQTGFDYAALPVESADQLRTWKIEIAAFTDTVESSLVQIGLRFQKAQDELKRQGVKGEGFAAWVKTETVYSLSNAYELINVTNRFKDKPLPNFGRSVLYALSAPSTPESVIDKAVAKAESGKKVTVAEVKDWKALEAKLETERQARLTAGARYFAMPPSAGHSRPALSALPKIHKRLILMPAGTAYSSASCITT